MSFAGRSAAAVVAGVMTTLALAVAAQPGTSTALTQSKSQPVAVQVVYHFERTRVVMSDVPAKSEPEARYHLARTREIHEPPYSDAVDQSEIDRSQVTCQKDPPGVEKRFPENWVCQYSVRYQIKTHVRPAPPEFPPPAARR